MPDQPAFHILPPAALPADWTAAARDRFAAFVDALDGPPLLVFHNDADGLSSGALLARAFRRHGGVRHGGVAPAVRIVGRGENAWGPAFAAELAGTDASGLIVADLGLSQRHPKPGTPLLVIDHHVPTGIPDGATVISGYGLDPVPTTSLLAFHAASGLGPVDDLDWLAGIGLLGDLGDKAPFDLLPAVKKRYGAGKLREATSLVNAPRRGPAGDGRPAFDLLMAADDPADIASGRHAETAACQAAREAVNAALAEGRKAPPRFGSRYGAAVAMVRLDSPCQIHPLVAQSWVGRLRGATVFAANFGFRPPDVHFSGRGAADADLVAFLGRHRPPGADPQHYGNGHRRAAGGALSPTSWNAFVDDLGFGPEMRAPEEAESVSCPPASPTPSA